VRIGLAIIGAGPAGMAAAALAAELGVETVLIDEQASPGGQIYRGIEHSRPDSLLGPDYLAGRGLAEALRASGVEFEQIIYPDEIHELLLHQDWLRAYHATADFFDKHLK